MKQLVRIAGKRPDQRLFPFTLHELESRCRFHAGLLNITQADTNPHAWRHGGPSEDVWRELRDLKEIQKRGQPKRLADIGRLTYILRESNYQGFITLEYEAKEDPFEAVPSWIAKLTHFC